MPAYTATEMADIQDPWRNAADEAFGSDSDTSDGVGVPTPDVSRTARKRRGLGVAFLVSVGVVGALLQLRSRSQQAVIAGDLDAENMELAKKGHERCHTATEGEKCYRDVDYAMNEHIKHHPDWYVGLTKQSSFEEFQNFLSKEKDEAGDVRCPTPCNLKAAIAKAKKRNEKNWGYTDECHDTKGGEPCFSHVKYTREQIADHPDWYPGLTKKSTIFEIQKFMYRQRDGSGHRVCPLPCTVSEDDDSEVDDDDEIDDLLDDGEEKKCTTAKKNSGCHIQVSETMKNVPKHPSEYPGLTKESTFKEVQAYLYEERDSSGERVCPMPCGKEFETADLEEEESGCKNARAGETCYNDIQYAMKQCKTHPEWYAGLDVNRSMLEFQAFLATQHDDSNKKKCPIPCNKTAIAEVVKLQETFGSCYTATKEANEECFKSVVWVATAGYKDPKFKKFYEGLGPKSSFEDVQSRLADDKKSKCNHKPCPCHTAVLGEKCQKSVKWVLKDGIDKHPDWYEGLKNTSSFEAVQKHLHDDPAAEDSLCLLPCVPPAWPWPED